MMNHCTPDVASEVRAAAAKKRATQSDLGEALHLSRMAVSRRFSGAVPFTADELVTLSIFLETPVAAFFGNFDPTPSPADSSSQRSAGDFLRPETDAA